MFISSDDMDAVNGGSVSVVILYQSIKSMCNGAEAMALTVLKH